MVTETRKSRVIEELLKTESNKILAEVEAVLNARSAPEFSGIISAEGVALMEAAIDPLCQEGKPTDTPSPEPVKRIHGHHV